MSKELIQEKMKTFYGLKDKHPGVIFCFRCGDFYELFQGDAKEGANILGITLTKLNDSEVLFATFPCHGLDIYLPKLIRAGKRVCICDQLFSIQDYAKIGAK